MWTRAEACTSDITSRQICLKWPPPVMRGDLTRSAYWGLAGIPCYIWQRCLQRPLHNQLHQRLEMLPQQSSAWSHLHHQSRGNTVPQMLGCARFQVMPQNLRSVLVIKQHELTLSLLQHSRVEACQIPVLRGIQVHLNNLKHALEDVIAQQNPPE